MKMLSTLFVALVLVFGAACAQQPGGEDEPEDGGEAETTAAGISASPKASQRAEEQG